MRIFIFILFILLLIGGWISGWFFVSGKVDEAITQTKQKLADNGQSLDCSEQEIDGFPFRISLNCETLTYANPGNQVTLSTGRFKSAAQAYQPNRLVAEIESPARVTLPGNDNFQADWQLMRTSLSAGLSGPSKFSLQGTQVQISPEQTTQPPMDVKDLQLHARRNGDEAIDVAFLLDDATTQLKLWPDYDLNLDARFDGIYSDLISRTDFLEIARTKGLKGELFNFNYAALEGGGVTLTGPFEVSPDGLVDGKFQVTLKELPKLLDALAKAFPKYEDNIAQASSALNTLVGSKKDGEFSLPIFMKNSKIIVGIFPVAELPPLY